MREFNLAFPSVLATSSISTAESSKPCIVVEERGTADSYTGTTVPSPSKSKYPVLHILIKKSHLLNL